MKKPMKKPTKLGNFILGIVVGIIFTMVFVVPFVCQAESIQSVDFTWTYSNPPTDLAGFHLWSSDTVDGNYTVIATFGPTERSHTIVNMSLDDRNNYFALSAFDDANQDSGRTNNSNGNFNPGPTAVGTFDAVQQ